MSKEGDEEMDGYGGHNIDIRNLLDNMPDSLAYCKFIVNGDDKPEDFFFFDINKAFEDIICVKRIDVIGKRVKELYPLVDRTALLWIQACDKVAFDLEKVDFEYFVPFTKKWYSVTAYSNHKYSFSAIFRDITEMKQKEEALTDCKKKYKVLSEKIKQNDRRENAL